MKVIESTKLKACLGHVMRYGFPSSDGTHLISVEYLLDYINRFEFDSEHIKHGYWFDKGSLSCRCSECGVKNCKETDFCPNCGAIMDENEEFTNG